MARILEELQPQPLTRIQKASDSLGESALLHSLLLDTLSFRNVPRTVGREGASKVQILSRGAHRQYLKGLGTRRKTRNRSRLEREDCISGSLVSAVARDRRRDWARGLQTLV